MLKIIDAKVIVTCPGRNFVTLKITTEDGVTGVGDATLNGREMAVVSFLQDHMVPSLIGRDAHQIEDIWQFFYRGSYWRGGPVAMTALAAVDMALWDIKGKVAGCRCTSCWAAPAARVSPSMATPTARHRGHHRRGRQVQGHGLQGHPPADGRAWPGQHLRRLRRQDVLRAGRQRLPTENVWSTAKYLNHVPQLFEKAREVLGWDVHLLHDVHHRLTPIEAARLGKDLEPYRLFWLEDSVAAENQAGFRIIRQHTTTPLAVGEIFAHIWDCKQLIEEQLIDYLRATVLHAGGITNLKKIAAFADLHHVKTGCHGATDLSPVTMAAALHLDMSIPNFGLQEYMRHTPETDAVFPHAYTFKDGMLHPGDKPGLGVDIDEDLAAKHPYKRAYLPVNRLEDGTMFNW
jgi:mannonate dehydratase